MHHCLQELKPRARQLCPNSVDDAELIVGAARPDSARSPGQCFHRAQEKLALFTGQGLSQSPAATVESHGTARGSSQRPFARALGLISHIKQAPVTRNTHEPKSTMMWYATSNEPKGSSTTSQSPPTGARRRSKMVRWHMGPSPRVPLERQAHSRHFLSRRCQTSTSRSPTASFISCSSHSLSHRRRWQRTRRFGTAARTRGQQLPEYEEKSCIKRLTVGRSHHGNEYLCKLEGPSVARRPRMYHP